jgi:transposase
MGRLTKGLSLSGARRVDDRRIVSGIVHMLRSGARWRDWGRGDHAAIAELRQRYVEALRAADGQVIEPLVAFARS